MHMEPGVGTHTEQATKAHMDPGEIARTDRAEVVVHTYIPGDTGQRVAPPILLEPHTLDILMFPSTLLLNPVAALNDRNDVDIVAQGRNRLYGRLPNKK